jgi:hypothetical protein
MAFMLQGVFSKPCPLVRNSGHAGRTTEAGVCSRSAGKTPGAAAQATRRRRASWYFSAVRATTSGGNSGPGDCLFQPEAVR